MIFGYGYAATGARVRKGIPNGVVQHAAIFPECNHARLPLEADLKFRLLDISEQEIQ